MTFYYQEFRNIVKYTGQIDLIAQAMGSYLLDKGITSREDFSFLDIGANDGELTDKVVKILSKLGKTIDVTALEPDKEPYDQLRKKPYRSLNISLEDWLGTDNHTAFDLILSSHILYHVPKERWATLTGALRQRLNGTGRLTVVLDSNDTEIYQLKDSLQLQTQIKDYGEQVFATDFQKTLEDGNVPYSQRTINSLIEVSSYQEMVRILSFLFRTQKEEIERNKDEVMRFIEIFKAKDCSVFDWRQEMFIVAREKQHGS